MDDATIHLFKGPPARKWSGRVQATTVEDLDSDSDSSLPTSRRYRRSVSPAPPPTPHHHLVSAVSVVVNQHELVRALSTLDVSAHTYYDPELGMPGAQPQTPVRSPAPRPGAPTPGSARSVSPSLSPIVPLTIGLGLHRRSDSLHSRSSSGGGSGCSSSASVSSKAGEDDGIEEDVFGPTTSVPLIGETEWSLSSSDTAPQPQMSLREMYLAGTNPPLLHRVPVPERQDVISSPGADDLTSFSPTNSSGSRARRASYVLRARSAIDDLSAGERHCLGESLIEAMDDDLERDYAALASFECLYETFVDEKAAGDWEGETLSLLQVSEGGYGSDVASSAAHSEGEGEEENDNRVEHVSSEHVSSETSLDETSPPASESSRLDEDNGGHGVNLGLSTIYELSNEHSEPSTPNDANEYVSDTSEDAATLRGSPATLVQDLTTGFPDLSVHGDNESEDSLSDVQSDGSISDDESDGRVMTAERRPVFHNGLGSVFADFPGGDRRAVEQMLSFPDPLGAHQSSRPAPGSASRPNGPAAAPTVPANSLRTAAALGYGPPPVRSHYRPIAPPIDTRAESTHVRAFPWQHGLGTGETAQSQDDSANISPPGLDDGSTDEAFDVRRVSFGSTDAELADRLRLSPSPTPPGLDESNITHRRRTTSQAAPPAAQLAIATEQAAPSSPGRGVPPWSASETLALLHGWTEGERAEKELAARRRHVAGTSLSLAGKEHTTARILELEAKIASAVNGRLASSRPRPRSPLTPVGEEPEEENHEDASNVEAAKSKGKGKGRPKSVHNLEDDLASLLRYQHSRTPTADGSTPSGQPPFSAMQVEMLERRLALLRTDIAALKIQEVVSNENVTRRTHGGLRHTRSEEEIAIEEKKREALRRFKFGSSPASPSPATASAGSATSPAASPSPSPRRVSPGNTFSSRQMDEHGFIDPRASTPHERRMRLSAPWLPNIDEREEYDQGEGGSAGADGVAGDEADYGIEVVDRNCAVDEDGEQEVGVAQDELGWWEQVYDKRYEGEETEEEAHRRRAMEDALRAVIARGRPPSYYSSDDDFESSVDGSYEYEREDQSAQPAADRAMLACYPNDRADTVLKADREGDNSDEGEMELLCDASDDNEAMPPTPRPAHATLPVPEIRAHRRTVSTPIPRASSLGHGAIPLPRPASRTPATQPFTPSRQHVYREQVDARHGGLSLDMIADRLMTTPPRPYFPPPPMGPVASRPQFSRSTPSVSVIPPAQHQQRSVSHGHPQHSRRVSTGGLQGILLHPTEPSTGTDEDGDADEALPHRLLSVEFASQPSPTRARSSSPPALQSSGGEHITPPRPMTPRPRSAHGHNNPSAGSHRRSLSGSFSFFSRLRSIGGRRHPDADEAKLNGHSEVALPTPPAQISATDDDGWEVWDLDMSSNASPAPENTRTGRTVRRRHKKHGSAGADLLRFIGL